MKSLNFTEFNSYTQWAESILMGAQLQNVWTHDWGLVLEFYKYRSLFLVIDLKLRPSVFILIQSENIKNSLVSKKTKPVGLFLNSHGKNLRVESFKSIPEYGRVARLKLVGKDQFCLIEIQMIPNLSNILISTDSKKISWNKPVELSKVEKPELSLTTEKEHEWLGREDDWIQEKFKANDKANSKIDFAKDSFENKAKNIAKKKKALEILENTDYQEQADRWRQFGYCLKEDRPVPSFLAEYYDEKLSRSENIEKAFKKAKDLESKKQGTIDRIEKLKIEIAGQGTSEEKSKTLQRKFKIPFKSRKLDLGNGASALCGKSASDNLNILRQARAWDLWLHLKDYPGAHGIIFREKNQNLSLEDLKKVAEWVIRESSAAKGFSWGSKYDVVVAECRFVRPIKGDKLGRVTYQNAQVYTFSSEN